MSAWHYWPYWLPVGHAAKMFGGPEREISRKVLLYFHPSLDVEHLTGTVKYDVLLRIDDRIVKIARAVNVL